MEEKENVISEVNIINIVALFPGSPFWALKLSLHMYIIMPTKGGSLGTRVARLIVHCHYTAK